jgi:RNA polymerase sigma factor (sigma-70 family)
VGAPRVETPAVKSTRTGLLAGRSPLLRLQSDERLIALIRNGHEGAFELLFERYRPRLLAFCRHMLGSKEDAEDVLQEVFTASYNAIRADDRALNVRPWLYRIARNRCLNHLRRPRFDGRDTMDDQIHGNGVTTADLVHRRADFRHLLQDIHKLPETQRTALLLREIDTLSYEQIADSMETTVPSVKSLLVRARMSLAEAAEARQLTCNDVRLELAEIAEGLKTTTAPVRRHVRDCEQCSRYKTQLRKTSTAMSLALPIGPMLMLKKLLFAKIGAGAAAASGGGAAAGGATVGGATAGGAAVGGAAAGGAAAGGIGAGTALPVGLGAVATKAITVTAATVILAGGAVEVKKVTAPERQQTPAPVVQEVQAPSKPDSGGQAASTLPPVEITKEKLKAADSETKTPDSEQATSSEPSAPTDEGTTGPVDPTTVGNAEPVQGQTSPPPGTPDTGGAALPGSGQSQPPAPSSGD